MKRFLILSVIVITVLAAFLLRAFTAQDGSADSSSPMGRGRGRGAGGQAIAVQTAAVAHETIILRREFTGTVKPSYSYVVAAKVSGRLLRVTKRIGDKVDNGEIVGYIDDTEYRHAFDEAKAQVQINRASIREAQAQVKHARKELSRVKKLVDKGISSQAELDAAETQCTLLESRLDLAKAQAAQREAVLAQAKTRLSHTAIRTVRSGYVAVRHVDGGALLAPNAAVLTVVGIDTVYVETAVSERDYPLIAAGQKATISIEGFAQRKFTGTIMHTAPLFQTQSRTAMTEIAIVNDSLLLKPGMFTRISIALAQQDSAQIIPSAALITRGDSTHRVFMVGASGTALLTPVTVGIIDGERVEITRPQLQGTVVTVGHHLLYDGAPVMLAQRELGSNDSNRNNPGTKAPKNVKGSSERGKQ